MEVWAVGARYDGCEVPLRGTMGSEFLRTAQAFGKRFDARGMYGFDKNESVSR